MIDRKHKLAVTMQCQILHLERSTACYPCESVSSEDLVLMRRIDERHLEYPFAGSRMLRDQPVQDGVRVGHRHVRTLMRRMGIEAISEGIARHLAFYNAARPRQGKKTPDLSCFASNFEEPSTQARIAA